MNQLKADDTKFLSTEQRQHITYVRESWTLLYELYNDWYEEMMDHVATDEPGQLVLLIGPTHVGKTAMMKFCDRILTEIARKAGRAVHGSAYIRLPASVGSKYDKGETYRRLHEAMLPMTPESFVTYGDPRDGAVKRSMIPRAGRAPTHAALLRAVVNRMNDGYAASFLDEVGELPLLLKSNAVMEAAMAIKEIADLSRKTAFIGGGPEVAPLLWQNAQLSARIQPIWMHPLDYRVKPHREQFAGVLVALAKELGPTYIKPDTIDVKNAMFIMRHVWGTVGLATKVILRMVSKSLRRDGAPLDWPLLEAGIKRVHDSLRHQMTIEHAMFAAAKDPERRADYWASAGYLNMRTTAFNAKTYEKSRDTDPLDSVREEVVPISRGRGKKGTARPEEPRRAQITDLPGESRKAA